MPPKSPSSNDEAVLKPFLPGRVCPLCEERMWRRESSVEVRDPSGADGYVRVHIRCHLKKNV